MMSGIKAKNTKPEITIRKALYALGFRYRLHAANVPGKPDLVLPLYKAAIFVNGCFWHGHDCPLFRLPETRRAFWDAKISRNRQRDAEVRTMLALSGWRHLTIWECAFRGRGKIGFPATIERAAAWLRSTDPVGEIRASLSPEAP